MKSSQSSIRTNGDKPRLEVLMSWWTMNGIGEGGREWTMEEKVRHIAKAGYDGINGALPASADEARWKELLEQYGLSFSVNAYPRTARDMADYIRRVKAYGHVCFINAQVMTPFVTDQAAEKLLFELLAISEEAEIPVYIETHRGTITQDLIRTAAYVRRLSALQLTIDFSHYVVAGEMIQVSDEAEAYLQELLNRTACIHARVSNGEQVQVDVGEKGDHPMLQRYERWWQSGMSHWLKSAGPGKAFPFVCELGPAPYAITLDESSKRLSEISDRWSQSLIFARSARAIWKRLTE